MCAYALWYTIRDYTLLLAFSDFSTLSTVRFSPSPRKKASVSRQWSQNFDDENKLAILRQRDVKFDLDPRRPPLPPCRTLLHGKNPRQIGTLKFLRQIRSPPSNRTPYRLQSSSNFRDAYCSTLNPHAARPRDFVCFSTQARKKRLYARKKHEFAVAKARLMEEQREEMQQRQENFSRAREKVPRTSVHLSISRLRRNLFARAHSLCESKPYRT